MVIRFLLPAATALILCACDSGGYGIGGTGDGPGGLCRVIASGGGFTCNGCVMVTNSSLAFDGSLETGAIVGTSGQGTFQGIAAEQGGDTYAGVVVVIPNTGNATVTVSTYLDGALQQTGGSNTVQGNGGGVCPDRCQGGSGGQVFVGFQVSTPYDEIRAATNNTGPTSMEVRELCVQDG